MRIGGNCWAVIQVQSTRQNNIGEDIPCWEDVLTPFNGWLDLITGDSGSINFNAKIQESTHVFLCDYFPLRYREGDEPDEVEITAENSRMLIDGRIYEVTIYDDPMNRHEHLEIFLKYIGG